MTLVNSKNNILIIGGDSTIGNNLFNIYKSQEATIFKTTRQRKYNSDIYLDLSSDKFELNLHNIKKVFFFAAVTSVEECEKNPIKTERINVKNTIKLMQHLLDNNVFIIFLSTSLVYGESITHPKVSDSIAPICQYGKQKAQVEFFLDKYKNKSCIVRLSKVIHNNLILFQNWIQNLTEEKNIYPFFDMKFSPINLEYTSDLLKKIEEINYFGKINISATDEISYYEAAQYLAKRLNLNVNKIIPISCKEKSVNNFHKHTSLNLDELRLLDLPIQASYKSLEFLV